jgi:DNA polymerase-3 subunit chi
VTELAFHFGAPDKLAYACRLLRKAVGSGARVLAVVDTDSIARLDADLWSMGPTEFLPHCLVAANESMLNHSPILLLDPTQQVVDQRGILVNLSDSVPEGFDRFERVIEVVSTDETDRNLARARWRHYTERGYQITRHDLNLKRAD